MVRMMATKAVVSRLERLEAKRPPAAYIFEVVIGGELEPGDIVIGGALVDARWQGDKATFTPAPGSA